MLIIYQCLCLQTVVLPASSQKYQLVHILKHCQIVDNLKLHFEIVVVFPMHTIVIMIFEEYNLLMFLCHYVDKTHSIGSQIAK